jgi:hypothetical protein
MPWKTRTASAMLSELHWSHVALMRHCHANCSLRARHVYAALLRVSPITQANLYTDTDGAFLRCVAEEGRKCDGRAAQQAQGRQRGK